MALFSCSVLGTHVELTEERERHIRDRHPDLLPAYRRHMIETVANPDQIRRTSRVGNAMLLVKWFAELRGGKYVVVVVIDDSGRDTSPWIITAYLTRKLAEGEIEWAKS